MRFKKYTSISFTYLPEYNDLLFDFFSELGELDKPFLFKRWVTKNFPTFAIIKIEDESIGHISKKYIGPTYWSNQSIIFAKKLKEANVSINKWGKHKLSSQTVYEKDETKIGKIFEVGFQ